VTELDVKEHDRSLSIRERDRRVADEARRYLDIAMDEPAVKPGRANPKPRLEIA